MKRSPKIEKICLYCERAVILDKKGCEPTVLCKGKKDVTTRGGCFRFRYDPLKQKPKERPLAPVLDPDSVIS